MICSKCNQDLATDCFHNRGDGKPHKQCKFCKRKAIKLHYEQNKSAYILRAKKKNVEYKDQIRQLIRSSKDKPCADCGVQYPYYVMDFDHKNDKVANVGEMLNCGSVEIVKEEIDKCDVVCANCHRERTFGKR